MSRRNSAIFIWDDLDKKIVQEPLMQRPDGCAFTATARQLEYQIRIAYAEADPSIQLKPVYGPIFNHVICEQQLVNLYPKRDLKKLWNPWELLEQVYDRCNGYGCPSFKHLRHWVKEIHHITNDGRSIEVEKIQLQLSKKIPLIAVINIFKDCYEFGGEDIYIGKAPPTEKNEINKLDTHAVVIVGDYIASENDKYGLCPGTYFLYQDSIHPNPQPVKKSLFGNAISILHPQVILSIYYGVATVPNLLVREEGIAESFRIGEDRLRKRRLA